MNETGFAINHQTENQTVYNLYIRRPSYSGGTRGEFYMYVKGDYLKPQVYSNQMDSRAGRLDCCESVAKETQN
jgi:hypothetical protein